MAEGLLKAVESCSIYQRERYPLWREESPAEERVNGDIIGPVSRASFVVGDDFVQALLARHLSSVMVVVVVRLASNSISFSSCYSSTS